MPVSIIRYILISFFFLIFASLCYAQNQKVGLSVDQSVYSFNLNPGDEQEFVLNVKNITSEKERAEIKRKDLSIDNDNKVTLLTDKNEVYGMKEWVVAEGDNVWLMEAGEERSVKFTVKVPSDASVGSHFSAVLFDILPEVDINNFQKPLVGGEIGTYIFLNVGGKISGKGAIENFTSPKVVDKKADFQVTFENQGNIHYVPYGEIKIKNILSRKNFDVDLEKHFVFPGKKYTFEYDWQVPSIFGVYTAEAFFVDQDGRNLSEKRILFGRAFLILAGVVSVFVVAGMVVFKKRRKKLKPKIEDQSV